MVRSLLETFAAVPDPRSAQGRRHPLAAILTLATAAMLAGARTRYDIWQWGRVQEPAVVRALGFTRDKTPAVSTLHRVCGAYLFVVKQNQPALYADITVLFAAPPLGERFGYAEQRGWHGDRREVRRVWASTALEGYLDWPGVRQVCKVEREVERKGQRRSAVRYVATSLGPGVGPGRLLELVRGHWVRDVTFGEDACRVRMGAAPEVLAALRNVVLSLLRRRGATNIAAALRQNGWQPSGVLRFLGVASG